MDAPAQALPRNVKTTSKGFYLYFKGKTGNGKEILEFNSGVTRKFELVKKWSEYLDGLRASNPSQSMQFLHEAMTVYIRRSRAEEDPPAQRDIPECGRYEPRTGAYSMRVNFKTEGIEWNTPSTYSIPLLWRWGDERERLMSLKRDKEITSEELVRRLRAFVFETKAQYEPRALPLHIRRQGLLYCLRYDSAGPAGNETLGCTRSVHDPSIARQLSEYFCEKVKPLGKEACVVWLNGDPVSGSDGETIVPCEDILEQDTGDHIHRGELEILQVVLLNGCVPSELVRRTAMLSDIEEEKIIARIREAGYPVMRTRMRACTCATKRDDAPSGNGKGLCDYMTPEDITRGSHILNSALNLDMKTLEEAGAMVGAADEMPHSPENTLFLFCGTLASKCVSAGQLHMLDNTCNYAFIPQAAQLCRRVESTRLAKVFHLLKMDGEDADKVRTSALASRREAGVYQKIGSASSATAVSKQVDGEYIAAKRKKGPHYEYQCALCDTWVSNGNWSQGHCKAIAHRANVVCAQVGEQMREHMRVPKQKRADGTIDCATCPKNTRIKLSRTAWAEHIATFHQRCATSASVVENSGNHPHE